MTDLLAFKKKLRARLKTLSDKAACHCGHEGAVWEMLNYEDRIVDWAVEEVRKAGGK